MPLFIPKEQEVEGYTLSVLRKLLPIFKECGINSLFNHGFIGLNYNRELTPEELRPLSENADELIPLQNNSVYFICRVEKPEELSNKTGSKVIRDMCLPSGGKFIIPIVTKGHFIGAAERLPWHNEIHKDISFTSSQTEIGWYNKKTNILWIGDIGHIVETSVANIEPILLTIRKLQRLGRLTDMKLTVGLDPEFEIINDRGQFIEANTVFADPNRDQKIGFDGHNATGEFRPDFATNPLRLARNMKRLIRKLQHHPNIDPDMKFYVGGGINVTTGGHIHFGVPYLPEEVKEALWKLVAAPVIKYQTPLRNGCKDLCSKGGRDIIRDSNHEPPKHGGVEWRPLPSFIIDESVTKAVICTAYAVVKSYYIGGLGGGSRKDQYRSLALYPAYKDYIELFIKTFVNPEVNLDFQNRDIIREWKLAKLNNVGNVVVKCDVPWLGKFFTPLRINLKKPIKVSVRFADQRERQEIAYWNIPQRATLELRSFARRHFVKCNVIPKETLEQAPTKYYRADMGIVLPQYWRDEDNGSTLFSELKDLIRSAILEYNSNL